MQARAYAAIALAAAVLCAPRPSQGQITSEVDARGKLVYTNADSYDAQRPRPIAGLGAGTDADKTGVANTKFILDGRSGGHCAEVSAGMGPIGQSLRNAAAQNRLDPALVGAVVCAESGGNPRAVSPKGAQGLMQLMPATARRLGVANAFDVKINLDGGARYLRFLLERYGGDLPKSLAAYNAGENAVDANGGIPPYPETQAYVRRIMESYGQSGAGRTWRLTRTAWPIRRDVDAAGRIVFTNE